MYVLLINFKEKNKCKINYRGKCKNLIYKKKYNESRKHHHKRALLYVARKLVRIIFSLLKNNKLYQTPDYLKQQKHLANKT
mgnify:CR=1 FL=1